MDLAENGRRFCACRRRGIEIVFLTGKYLHGHEKTEYIHKQSNKPIGISLGITACDPG